MAKYTIILINIKGGKTNEGKNKKTNDGRKAELR